MLYSIFIIDIYSILEKYFDGIIVRVEIVKMFSNTKVRKHVDGGQFLQQSG